MPSRVRTRNFGLSSGGQRTLTNKFGPTTYLSGLDCETNSEYMEDVTGNPLGENPMFRRVIKVDPLRVNGSRKNGSYEHFYSNVIPFPYGSGSLTHSLVGLPSLSWLITEALARANPASDPDFDALNFGWELREFPRMLLSLGQLFKRGYVFQSLTGLDIGFRFGWKPLLADMRKLLVTVENVERRIQRLKRLKKGFSTDLGTFDSPPTPQLLNWANDVKGTRTRVTTQHAWAYISYQHDADIDFGYDADLAQKAFDLAFNTKLSAATIWNSIPWTWLIDYLGNVGTFLEVHRGNMPVKVSTVTLMRETFTTFTDVPTSPTVSTVVYSGGNATLHTKQRDVHYNPTALLALAPGIGAAQLTNLASLALAVMGRNPQVQRTTGVKSPAWYAKVAKATKQQKRYGKSYIKLR